MIEFILNNEDISTDLAAGTTVLDFVRYHKSLKGTKIGCREGDCGACTILVGELVGNSVKYRSMTSCLMPLANAAGKHIVTVEGINPTDGSLTPVQQAMVDESGTQCGFCTVGFVMSLTGFCVDRVSSPHVSKGSTQAAISAIDGNICRCTGYKSIERAAEGLCRQLAEGGRQSDEEARMSVRTKHTSFVPEYFNDIASRLGKLLINRQLPTANRQLFVSGGTDVYVQRPDAMAESEAAHLFYDDDLRGIRDLGDTIEIGASATVTDLLESPLMQSIFPALYKHIKLVSSTPIRNMATLAGNFVNASPIGDMTVWFLALDADILIETNESLTVREGLKNERTIKLHELYLGYKQLAKADDEIITAVRFKKPVTDFRFNFEKVCKRTYLDIATVNTAISMSVDSIPGEEWIPPALRGELVVSKPSGKDVHTHLKATDTWIAEAHVAAGGIAPVPLYLKETSAFLKGKPVNAETIAAANELMQSEISPISDVRGTEEYKRLLLRQLFRGHFYEMFGTEFDII
jgi:xanthine dehydrogenase small subunit